MLFRYVAPAIHVVKSASPTSVREGGAGGDQVTYTYQVTNTSTGRAHDPTPVARSGGRHSTAVNQRGESTTDGILQHTETWPYTLSVTPPARIVCTSHTTTAMAVGMTIASNQVSGTGS